MFTVFCFFRQKTAYERRISDWSSDVCSSDLAGLLKRDPDKVPLDKALAYAAEDADITLRLHEVLKPRLVSDRLTTIYETIERQLGRASCRDRGCQYV